MAKRSFKTKAIDLAKEIARSRGVCLRCPNTAAGGYMMHGAHVFPVNASAKLASDYKRNIMSLCFTCHRWWHNQPTESGEWFRKKFPEQYQELLLIKQSIYKVNWQLRYEELLKIKKEMGL